MFWKHGLTEQSDSEVVPIGLEVTLLLLQAEGNPQRSRLEVAAVP